MAKTAKDFLSRINTDKAFAQAFFTATSEEAKHAILNKEGFEFSQKDIQAAMKEVALSDHALDMVAGGTCAQCTNGWKW